MQKPIVASNHNITLIGSGDLAPRDLAEALSLAPVLVAADSGADAALAQGHVPDAVIGDFDSLSDAARAALPPDRLHQITEQESTDFDKALRHVAAPLMLAVGFLGARIDHQLAVLNVLARRSDRACILLGGDELIFAAPPQLTVALDPGDIVSLFPMRRVTGRSQGLTWPIDGLILEPHGRVGTSNRAEGAMTLDIDGPGLLVILPRRVLPAAMAALSARAATWNVSDGQPVHT